MDNLTNTQTQGAVPSQNVTQSIAPVTTGSDKVTFKQVLIGIGVAGIGFILYKNWPRISEWLKNMNQNPWKPLSYSEGAKKYGTPKNQNKES